MTLNYTSINIQRISIFIGRWSLVGWLISIFFSSFSVSREHSIYTCQGYWYYYYYSSSGKNEDAVSGQEYAGACQCVCGWVSGWGACICSVYIVCLFGWLVIIHVCVCDSGVVSVERAIKGDGCGWC